MPRLLEETDGRLDLWRLVARGEPIAALYNIVYRNKVYFYQSGRKNGNFEAGVVASLFSLRVSIVSGGVLCVIGCLVCAAALPAFRAYDARLYHLAPDPQSGSVKRGKQ